MVRVRQFIFYFLNVRLVLCPAIRLSNINFSFWMLRLKIKGLVLSAENESAKILSPIFIRQGSFQRSHFAFLHFRRSGFGARDQLKNNRIGYWKKRMIIVTLLSTKRHGQWLKLMKLIIYFSVKSVWEQYMELVIQPPIHPNFLGPFL